MELSFGGKTEISFGWVHKVSVLMEQLQAWSFDDFSLSGSEREKGSQSEILISLSKASGIMWICKLSNVSTWETPDSIQDGTNL